MIGQFVGWVPATGRRKNSPGWIIAENGCHLWTGGRTREGYGMVMVEGKSRSINRLRYEREVGPIPEGLQLDHFACDNGPGGCCNPLHVRPVTHRENALRSETSKAALHASRTHCPKGHPLSGDNLLASGLRKGKRKCRTCKNSKPHR